jgi:hypothetical protein
MIKPGDLIRWANKGGDHLWVCTGVYLGAVGQESVIQVENVSHAPAWTRPWETHVMMFIPECLLRECEIIPPLGPGKLLVDKKGKTV